MFGLSLGTIRLALIGTAALALVTAGLAYRQHLINTGWDRALDRVKSQDAGAKEAASRAQRTADDCYAANGSWSVIMGACTP